MAMDKPAASWKQRLRACLLPTISFATGFSLLTYELAAARVLAPTIGSSTYVWTYRVS